MQVKHAYPAETDPTTQMGAPQEQRAPAKASETQLRKRVSSSLGPSSGLTWMCSSTYLSIAIGTKPIPQLPSPVRRYLYGTSCAPSQSPAISASASSRKQYQLFSMLRRRIVLRNIRKAPAPCRKVTNWSVRGVVVRATQRRPEAHRS